MEHWFSRLIYRFESAWKLFIPVEIEDVLEKVSCRQADDSISHKREPQGASRGCFPCVFKTRTRGQAGVDLMSFYNPTLQ